MGRRRRAACCLALVVVAGGCSGAESATSSAGEIARNEELERLATGDRDPLIDVITHEGREFELVAPTDPADPPTYEFPTCRTDLPVERDLALADVPFTDWSVDRADAQGVSVSRLVTVVWGGGGDDESQAADEYQIELALEAAVAGCARWTLAFAPFG